MKVIGFCEMKKTEGKVVFTVEKGKYSVVGESCEILYLYGDVSKKVNESMIGKEVSVTYGRGYSGKAYIADIVAR